MKNLFKITCLILTFTLLFATMGLSVSAVGLTATGFNINVISLFTELNPHICCGGDDAVFWKPLSWTIIFGLSFAFFMTLIMVPAMYIISERLRRPMRNTFGGKWISMLGIPPLTLLFMPLMIISVIKQKNKRKQRAAKLKGQKVNDAFIGSWF